MVKKFVEGAPVSKWRRQGMIKRTKETVPIVRAVGVTNADPAEMTGAAVAEVIIGTGHEVIIATEIVIMITEVVAAVDVIQGTTAEIDETETSETGIIFIREARLCVTAAFVSTHYF